MRQFLFGFKARGDDKPYSDIDIMVLLSKCDSFILRKIDDIDHEVDAEFDVVLTTIVGLNIVIARNGMTKQSHRIN